MPNGQPPFTTNPILLKNLLAQVGQGALQLPDFQRGWVWDDDRIKGLIASISKGFPIGAVMTHAATDTSRSAPDPSRGRRILPHGEPRRTTCWTASNASPRSTRHSSTLGL